MRRCFAPGTIAFSSAARSLSPDNFHALTAYLRDMTEAVTDEEIELSDSSLQN
jgi:hypothetical protein